jgi:small redox-active disulfide protein 2
MKIKILGGGCPRCEKLEKTAREAAQELGIDAEFNKIKNMTKIMEYDILETPALVINEQVKSSGNLPSKEEIMEWMAAEK